MRNTILQRLKSILMADEYLVLKDQVSELSEESSLIDDLIFDSLQILNLIVLIEEEFGFVSEAEELELDMFDKISMLIDFIQQKIAEKNCA